MTKNIVQRPRRWDEPFCNDMSDVLIDQVMSSLHFSKIKKTKFPTSLPLSEIIRNDCRVRNFQEDQLIINAGTYINSAFLILSGTVTLVLAPGINPQAWGQTQIAEPSVFSALKKWMFQSKYPEVRAQAGAATVKNISEAPAVRTIADIDDHVEQAGAETLMLQAGDLFGESAVLGRTEMANTVVSQGETQILEIRWQGLRDISKYDANFKQFIERLYRERGLYEHLLSVPLFRHLEKDKIRALADIALFEVHGEFEWQRSFKTASKQAKTDEDYNRLIKAEPVIAKEGDYPDGLLLIRNGFARVSRLINHGHYTLGHMAADSLFGLQELYDSWSKGEPEPLRCSLRALGYTDIIRIPSKWLEHNVFAAENATELKVELEHSLHSPTKMAPETNKQSSIIDRKFTEFLVENRLINGTQTMMIDLERCVRCDDCVTACANAHDNNPRFVRHGPTFDSYMIANACMHCDDPVCMIGCPTGAIHRSEDGVVVINDTTCIGCSTCANNCPYDNIRMVQIRGTDGQLFTDQNSAPIVKATKCDLCSDVPGGPACARACPHDALVRIDVKETNTLASWINR